MFISSKRHEREKQELLGAQKNLTDLLLGNVAHGLFALDAQERIVAPLSQFMPQLFGRRDFFNLTFEQLLQPVVSKKALSLACAHLARLRAAPENFELPGANPLDDVEVRVPREDGSHAVLHLSFDFVRMQIAGEPGNLLVRVVDRTTPVLQARELTDLRARLRTQAEILRSVLKIGRARFAASVQTTDAAMNKINEILKQPAREQTAFRGKLEQTLAEVDRVRRESAVMKISSLADAAQQFETSLQDLKSRRTLSGNDFLPLAVKLDELFGEFALLRSLTKPVQSAPPAEPAPAAAPQPAADKDKPRVTENGTEIIAAPKFIAQLTPQESQSNSPRGAPPGSLENTLSEMTEHVAQENGKAVVLQCVGLLEVPATYQSTVKNIAIQLIRNAVLHGIEPVAEREQAGKPSFGTLQLEFKPQRDGSYEMRFQDDGRGVDPDMVRDIAITKKLITPEMAENLRDRQAIKLIFKAGYTTLAQSPGQPTHGAGLSFVRRYVHDAGGKIALASAPGRETRFKVSLPRIVASESQVA